MQVKSLITVKGLLFQLDTALAFMRTIMKQTILAGSTGSELFWNTIVFVSKQARASKSVPTTKCDKLKQKQRG